MIVDVFSDASQNAWLFTGAYIVGHNGEPTGVIHEDCKTSTEAELRTAAMATDEARRMFPDSIVKVHIDLAEIHKILLYRRVRGSMVLRHSLDEAKAEIFPDANNYKTHKKCHHHARVMAGIYGTEHPKRPKGKKVPKLRRFTREKFLAVMEVFANHPAGATETQIALESGLGLSAVHKILRNLQGHDKVRCERPDGVAQCDLAKWKWFIGPQFGTLLGELMAKAGIVAEPETA